MSNVVVTRTLLTGSKGCMNIPRCEILLVIQYSSLGSSAAYNLSPFSKFGQFRSCIFEDTCLCDFYIHYTVTCKNGANFLHW